MNTNISCVYMEKRRDVILRLGFNVDGVLGRCLPVLGSNLERILVLHTRVLGLDVGQLRLHKQVVLGELGLLAARIGLFRFLDTSIYKSSLELLVFFVIINHKQAWNIANYLPVALALAEDFLGAAAVEAVFSRVMVMSIRV